jgi:tetratricopeptide (TPR) repeat protein
VAERGQPHQGSHRLVVLALVAALVATGCAGYAGDVKEIRSALLAGNKKQALAHANAVLEVEKSRELPEDVSGDNALLVLERGTVKQGMGRHEGAARDFRVADQHLELLDIKNDTAGNIGKWLFSDDVTVYKAPPHEKLLLNTLGMVNYLTLGDLESARVEARRFTVMQSYLGDEVSKQESTLGLGSYLRGFTYEMSGRYDEALRSYDEALDAGDYPSAEGAIRRIAGCTEYRTERISKLLGETAPDCAAGSSDKGTILVVSTLGLAPYKQATRIPIGAALVMAAHVTYGPGLGTRDQARANELAAKGLLKWINFPRLTKSKPRFDRVRVEVDGESAETEVGQNVTQLVIDAWNRIKGTLMAAAIVRMIARAVAGEATNQAAEAGGAAGPLALLAGLAVEGALTAADTPDTRSWVTLPSRVMLSRIEVTPGKHTVAVSFEGSAGRVTASEKVRVPAGGFAVVSAASMR